MYSDNAFFSRGIPFGRHKSLAQTVKLFADYAERKGCTIYRSPIQNYNFSENIFDGGWQYKKGRWFKRLDKLKPDFVFDKTKFEGPMENFHKRVQISANYKYFNNPYVSLFIKNKLSQVLIFKDFMPKSLFVNNIPNIEKSLEIFQGEQIVLKPLWGSGGKGMYIGPKRIKPIKFFIEENSDKNLIMQEFINFKKVNNRLVDFRLVFSKGRLVFSVSRVSLRSSVFTNVSKGANAKIIPLDEIPAKVVRRARLLSERISCIGDALYSLDFMLKESGEPVFIEANTIPGFFYEKELLNPDLIKLQRKFYDSIIDFY